jgi:drug/metabolite transporter (DMT)-like permease
MNAKIHQQMSPSDIVILIILSLLWGGSFFFIEVLVDYLPPLTIVTARVGLAALLLWGIVFATGIARPTETKDWIALGVVGFLNNALPFSMIVWGQTQIDSGLASVLNATAPLFTVIVAGTFLADERLTKNKLAGVTVGLAGICVLVGPNALQGLGQSFLGQLAVIGAALSYALAGVFSRRFSARGIPPLMIATGQVSAATLLLIIPVILVDGSAIMTPLPITAWGALLGLAVFSTVLAYILYFRLLASAGATNAALVTFLIPISAVALGAAFLGERLTPVQAGGAALIGVGLIIMDGRLFNRA